MSRAGLIWDLGVHTSRSTMTGSQVITSFYVFSRHESLTQTDVMDSVLTRVVNMYWRWRHPQDDWPMIRTRMTTRADSARTEERRRGQANYLLGHVWVSTPGAGRALNACGMWINSKYYLLPLIYFGYTDRCSLSPGPGLRNKEAWRIVEVETVVWIKVFNWNCSSLWGDLL